MLTSVLYEGGENEEAGRWVSKEPIMIYVKIAKSQNYDCDKGPWKEMMELKSNKEIKTNAVLQTADYYPEVRCEISLEGLT